MSTEVIPCAIAARYYAKNAGRFLRKQRIAPSSILFFNKKSTLFREPYGVVGIISPWNYPFSIPFNEVMVGLLCGNAVILKVATQAQPVGECIKDIVEKSGLPGHLFQLVHLPAPRQVSLLQALLLQEAGSARYFLPAQPRSAKN